MNSLPNQRHRDKSAKPLKEKLSSNLSLSILVPLLLLSAIAIAYLANNSTKNAKQRLEKALALLTDFTRQRIQTGDRLISSIAVNPTVIDFARAGSQTAAEENLTNLSIEELEQRFASNKLLTPNQQTNDYLRQIAQIGNFAELFFTESHGFNVAYTQKTSDFVQRDEQWWQQGKANRSWIGEPTFDESAGAFSISLVRAIEDPQTGKFLGVIKGVFATANFQQIQTEFQQKRLPLSNSEKIQVVVPASGVVVYSLSAEKTETSNNTIDGKVLQRIQSIYDSFQRDSTVAQQSQSQIRSFTLHRKQYAIAAVPQTNWVAVASVNQLEVISLALILTGELILLLILLVGWLSWRIRHLAWEVSSPLQDLANASQQLASGNLEVRATPKGSLETRHVATCFNDMVEQLSNLMDEKEKVRQQTMHLLSDIQNLIASIQQVAQNTQAAEEQVSRANQTVQTADTSMERTVTGIETVRRAAESTQERVSSLTEASQKISQVVNLIEEFSNQTNLLALNASIEATRAGSYGKGFSVVAREIRTLAQKSANSTSEINGLVGSIQQEMQGVVQSVASGTQEIGTVTSVVHQTRQQLSQVTELMEEVRHLVGEIAETTSTQADTSESLNQSIQQVAEKRSRDRF